MAEKDRGLASFVTSVGMRSVQAVRETGYLRRCWSNPSLAAGGFPPPATGAHGRHIQEAMSAGVNAVPIVGWRRSPPA